jgi:hypothetical protein
LKLHTIVCCAQIQDKHAVGAPLEWLCKQAGAAAMQQPGVAQCVLQHLPAIPKTHKVICKTLAQAGMRVCRPCKQGMQHPVTWLCCIMGGSAATMVGLAATATA